MKTPLEDSQRHGAQRLLVCAIRRFFGHLVCVGPRVLGRGCNWVTGATGKEQNRRDPTASGHSFWDHEGTLPERKGQSMTLSFAGSGQKKTQLRASESGLRLSNIKS